MAFVDFLRALSDTTDRHGRLDLAKLGLAFTPQRQQEVGAQAQLGSEQVETERGDLARKRSMIAAFPEQAKQYGFNFQSPEQASAAASLQAFQHENEAFPVKQRAVNAESLSRLMGAAALDPNSFRSPENFQSQNAYRQFGFGDLYRDIPGERAAADRKRAEELERAAAGNQMSGVESGFYNALGVNPKASTIQTGFNSILDSIKGRFGANRRVTEPEKPSYNRLAPFTNANPSRVSEIAGPMGTQAQDLFAPLQTSVQSPLNFGNAARPQSQPQQQNDPLLEAIRQIIESLGLNSATRF